MLPNIDDGVIWKHQRATSTALNSVCAEKEFIIIIEKFNGIFDGWTLETIKKIVGHEMIGNKMVENYSSGQNLQHSHYAQRPYMSR